MKVFKNFLSPVLRDFLDSVKITSSFILIATLAITIKFYFFDNDTEVLLAILILSGVTITELYHTFKEDQEIHRVGYELLFVYTLAIFAFESTDFWKFFLFKIMIVSVLIGESANILIKSHNAEVRDFIMLKKLGKNLTENYETFESAELGTYKRYYDSDIIEIDLRGLKHLRKWKYGKKIVEVTLNGETISTKTRRNRIYLGIFNNDINVENDLKIVVKDVSGGK